MVQGISGSNSWYKTLVHELDAMDGRQDGVISAKNWNTFLDRMHSKGNRISFSIKAEKAEKSFRYYMNVKDVNNKSADWTKWEENLNQLKKDLGIEITSKSQKKTDSSNNKARRTNPATINQPKRNLASTETTSNNSNVSTANNTKTSSIDLTQNSSFEADTVQLINKKYEHSTRFLDTATKHLGIVEVTSAEYKKLSPEEKSKTQMHVIGSYGDVTHQWCAHAVSHIAEENGMDIGGHKATVQGFINWAKNRYKSISTIPMTASNMKNERAKRKMQLEKQLPDMKEGDFIIWKTNYILGSTDTKSRNSSHIGIIEKVDVKNGLVTVIEGNANEYRTEDGERVLATNRAECVNGDQSIGEAQEVNRRDGLIRKVYTLDELANYGYSGYIDNSNLVT